MASPPTSLLVSSEEICNGAKLRRLILDGGTPALRRVFDGFHPPANPAADLNANRPILNNLFRKNKVDLARNLIFFLGQPTLLRSVSLFFSLVSVKSYKKGSFTISK